MGAHLMRDLNLARQAVAFEVEREGASGLGYQAEAMVERIAAVRGLAMLGVVEAVLDLRAGCERPLDRVLEVVDVDVQVHGRPVAIVVTGL